MLLVVLEPWNHVNNAATAHLKNQIYGIITQDLGTRERKLEAKLNRYAFMIPKGTAGPINGFCDVGN